VGLVVHGGEKECGTENELAEDLLSVVNFFVPATTTGDQQETGKTTTTGCAQRRIR